jgi:RimJ/RimL family protein N-acetyltransferase
MGVPDPTDDQAGGGHDHAATILRDGSHVEIRTMRGDDEERLLRFHHTLSPETTRRRFFAIHPELSPDELYRFTHVDHTDREALVALVVDEIVAVARFDRIGRGPVAEIAFVVADEWQGRGLATLLLAKLADRAGAVGIDRFVAETLSHNDAMLAVFRHAGYPTMERTDHGVVHITIELGLRCER